MFSSEAIPPAVFLPRCSRPVKKVPLEDRMTVTHICDIRDLAMALVDKCSLDPHAVPYPGEDGQPWNVDPVFKVRTNTPRPPWGFNDPGEGTAVRSFARNTTPMAAAIIVQESRTSSESLPGYLSTLDGNGSLGGERIAGKSWKPRTDLLPREERSSSDLLRRRPPGPAREFPPPEGQGVLPVESNSLVSW